MNKIKIGIIGYGNLGKGVVNALKLNPDMELKGIFTRRDASSVEANGLPMLHISTIANYKNEIDVMILCGGSATDLPKQGPMVVEMFNTVDSFDTHAKIPEYFEIMDKIAKESNKVGLISVGWDPGLFSLNRLLASCVLPNGTDYTFWGKGVSQGHSDALRRIDGVTNAIQYTIPKEEALESVRAGKNPKFETRDKHFRLCYVVVNENADKVKIEKEIIEMPNYFSDYDTEVNFITEEELQSNHKGMPHGGFVIRTGETSEGTKQKIEFSLELASNPEFTSSVLVAYARATYKLSKDGVSGAKTVFDIPYGLLSPKSPAELRKELL
ncbi:diaminopimelate dehydrogenase [uncultured Clostridium sp.]|jgi:diaminopimelate dehydrogenase|uniref:diaminopimelate dehydrogenase n=1 Tax=uncultured Clostridium sp. TaxID=59620 RepID=UPI00262FFAF6|nr:diaminopimelate dehydrogenase [uncultured Clostridium sp.]